MKGLYFIAILTGFCRAEVGHYLQQVSQRQVLREDDGQYHEEHNEWDIRLSVPGEPGRDYPTFGSIPRTEFTCAGKEAGYYADLETNCQVFRVCTTGSTFGYQSFLCPNGTIFNQQVFVCDWWMNVNCQTSQKYFQSNSQRFGNIRVGSEFMQDIRKMIMHPMQNPYSQNQIVHQNRIMQVYRPPAGQLFGTAIFQSKSAPVQSYVPAQTLRTPFVQGKLVDSSFVGSTPSPQYVPANNAQQVKYIPPLAIQQPTYVPPNIVEQFKYIPPTVAQQINYLPPNNAQINSYNGHYAINSQNADYTSGNLVQENIGQYNGHAQYVSGINHASQQYNQQHGRVGNQITQNANYRLPNQLSNIQSNTIYQTPVQTQPVETNRFPSGGGHNQQINALYNIEQAARYTSNQQDSQFNNIPNNAVEVKYTKQYTYPLQNEKQVTYRAPAQQGQSGYIISQKSVVQTKQDLVSQPEVTKVPNPNYVPAKVIAKTITINKNASPARLTASKAPMSKVTVKSWIVQSPKAAPLTARSSVNPRKYLTPTMQSPFTAQKRAQLRSAPLYLAPLIKKPPNNTFTITKHSHINTNHNNLTFTDILTKEKLDITVKKVVKDTSKLLGGSSITKTEKTRQNLSVPSSDVPLPKFIPPQKLTRDYEKITTYSPHNPSSVAKTVLIPSGPTHGALLAPLNSNNPKIKNISSQLRQRINQETNSRFTDAANTVTIKITIPIKTAANIFKTKNESEFERLEILHTGNSNFLVLTNARAPSFTHNKFIPLGKLIVSNISNSQAYVQDILAKTLNAARNYENTINDNFERLNLISTDTFGHQFQTLNQEDYNEISQKVTKQKNAQYNIQPQRVPTYSGADTTSTQNQNSLRGSARYTEAPNAQQVTHINKQIQSTADVPARTGSFYSSTFYSGREPQSNQAAKLQVAPINSNDQPVREQNQQKQILSTQTESFSTTQNISPTRHTELEEDDDDDERVTTIVQTSTTENVAPSRQSNEVELLEPNVNVRPLSSQGSAAKLQLAPELEPTVQNQFHETEFVNTEEDDDEKQISYKADKAYYVYSKNPNGGPNQQRKGNLIQQSATYTENENNGQKQIITTVQFIPSIGFQLDNENDKQKLINAINNGVVGDRLVQSQEGYIYNRPANIVQTNTGYGNRVVANVEAEGYPRVTPATLYAGPSSYSAPQRSVGGGYVLAPQIVQPTSPPTNTFLPARLEEFDDNQGYPRVTPDQGYPRVTPAIAFNY